MGKYKYIHNIGEQFYIETEIHFEEEGEKQGECAAETSADLENLRQRQKLPSFCMGPIQHAMHHSLTLTLSL